MVEGLPTVVTTEVPVGTGSVKSRTPELTIGIRDFLIRHKEAGGTDFQYERDHETLRANLTGKGIALPESIREVPKHTALICRLLDLPYVNSNQAHPNGPKSELGSNGNGSAPTDAVTLLRQYRKDGEEMAKIQKRRSSAEKFLRGAGLAHLIDRQAAGRKRK